jgi:tetratricopeptide (TPR) repeat protein
VGRSVELAAISEAIAALGAGLGEVLLICGEPGIGKSTLAREVAAMAHTEQLAVHWGFAWEAGDAPAYWLWTQLLRSLITAQSLSAERFSGLSQILPEHASPVAQSLQAEQARFQLLEAVRELLTSAAQEQALVLLFEDLHAADSDSVQLLHYIARHSRSLPVLLVGTYRDREASGSRAAEPLWRIARDARVLQLSPLSADEIGALLRRKTGSEPDTGQVQQLYAATEGNPLFLTELMGLLQHGDAISPACLPDTVHQVLEQQLARLPRETRAALASAAILGREFGNRALAQLSDQSYQLVCSSLQPATAAGIIEIISVERNRFCHILYCDVLLLGMAADRREALHQRQAELIEDRINHGERQSGAELAQHLMSAGLPYREAAIAAWRSAAEDANQRQALAEAARALKMACEAAQSVPMSTAARCELTLEYARAAMLKGDIECGQQLCGEAFETATAIDDAQLMARAALTCGSVFVAAHIDEDLIDWLQQCLQRLPASDTATRARVSARLAGALQPAPNPQQPLTIALEAIALARSTGDRQVIYEVLQSAISALMDFYPASKRVPLNRECCQLAEQFGDIAGRFRSYLRLAMDACELADRAMLEQAVAACRRIAERIQLPHYQWWAASMSALSATIDGDFATASKLLEQAQSSAATVDDRSAQLAIPLQRLILLAQWQSPKAPSVDALHRELERIFRARPNTRLWVRPWLALVDQALGQADVAILDDSILLEQIFADGDRMTTGHIGELAVLAGDLDLAARVYTALLPYQADSASGGLMGPSWHGPVARFLGVLATALGKPGEARQHFQHALALAQGMGCDPLVARIHEHIAELAAQTGDSVAATRHRKDADRLIARLCLRPLRTVCATDEVPAPLLSGSGFSMQLEGDIWRVAFNGDSALIKQSKGMSMLASLIAKPDQELHVLDLATPASQSADRDCADAGPLLDQQARAQYQARVATLREELEEARALGDIGRSDALQEELGFISRELSRAYGLGGRQRVAGSAAERARVNVQRRLRDAIARIEKPLPAAGRYLDNTIKTGNYCRYTPM